MVVVRGYVLGKRRGRGIGLLTEERVSPGGARGIDGHAISAALFR